MVTLHTVKCREYANHQDAIKQKDIGREYCREGLGVGTGVCIGVGIHGAEVGGRVIDTGVPVPFG